ncbi:substrate-binding domain-containing protein [Sulfobacillus thermosulfidooxidans]|uniref:substrate-binding domain-containing protein n=1 Tax=Sulfobacillus thermosulfidooxidans TaxID=28034 RepID=UPI0006B50F0A|nr:substrate-binding domain-containing protein [Sulfobacillus thermosulfidooxidans]
MSQSSRRARIGDVAKLAGVSIATVSYVLNNQGHFSQETIQKVHDAARILNYAPNVRGRILVRGISETIGILLPASLTPNGPEGIFPTLMEGVIAACQEKGYHVMVLSPTIGDIVSYLEQVSRSGRIDGLILFDDPGLERYRDILTRNHLPFVVYGAHHEPHLSYDTDFEEAARIATQYLIDLGHQRITLIIPDELTPNIERYRQGYAAAMVKAHLNPHDVLARDKMKDDSYHLTYELLTQISPPTALLVTSGHGALQARRCAGDLGIHVPRQLSIMSLEPLSPSLHMHSPLSSMDINLKEAGYQMANMLINSIQGQPVHSVRVIPHLNIRGSTGIPAIYQTPRTNLKEPVLKAGPTFAIFSPQGRIEMESKRHGIYCYDTRMVSIYQWRIGEEVPDPLHFDVTANTLTWHYVIQQDGMTRVLQRCLTLHADHFTDHWQWQHYGSLEPWNLSLSIDADFTDIFELRGTPKIRSGIKRKASENEEYRLEYEGIDGITRVLRMSADKSPIHALDGDWKWCIDAQETCGELTLRISWHNPVPEIPQTRLKKVRNPLTLDPHFIFDEYPWHLVISQAHQDYHMLLTDFGHGPVPMAGLPWFGTFFGRDAIIASYQYLLWNPVIAQNTLYTLAAWQGKKVDPTTEEEPGKMIHEIRLGEMARSRQVPFARYYGSVDVTPLFLILLMETWKRTGNHHMMADLMPAAEKALNWLLGAQDSQTGLFSFQNHVDHGLVIQSWKDSFDSMVYSTGEHAIPPLAVSEVQGYAYRALILMSQYYQSTDQSPKAQELLKRAKQLKRQFHKRYWLDEKSYYALALDHSGRPLDVLTSDAGQCLWTGIVPHSRSLDVAKILMSPVLYSGWGIRTLSSDALTYDPYSYHRGSIWPHDTALIAKGLSHYGLWPEAHMLSWSLLQAASQFPYGRLPELFSGEPAPFGPYPYPAACSPQAWAAGAPFLLLQVLLGMDIDVTQKTLHLHPGDLGPLGPTFP